MHLSFPSFRRFRVLGLPSAAALSILTATIALTGLATPAAAVPDDVTGTDEVMWKIERPQRQTIRAIQFIDERHGWFVAGERSEDCVIMRTDDGGDSWHDVGCPVSQRPEAVFFVNERTGWVVGNNGLILRTDNGGRGWGRQNSDSKSTLTGVHAVDTSHAWVSTRGGDVLRTTDGGAEWDREGTGGDTGLFDVHFINREHGWATGSDGRVVRTQNGGREWYRQDSETDGTLSGIDFFDIGLGWVVGHHIRFTENGGGDWDRQVRVEKSLEDVDVVDADFVWAVGDEGLIMLTRDRGATWNAEGDSGRWERRGIRSVTSPDRGHMWAGATGGFVIRRLDTSITAPEPTSAPTERPVEPTSTPRPPTSTPRPRTPTPTITPTPVGAWIDIATTGQPFLVPAYGEQPIDVAYGNMSRSEVMTATIEGAIVFPDGGKTYSTTLFTSGGQGAFPIVIMPDTSADPAPMPGDELILEVTMGGTTARLRGQIAYRAIFPWILKNHPEWLLPRE